MRFNLDDAIQLLRSTPDTLWVMLAGVPEEWTSSNEGPETWSPFDVVGHLIHGEKTDWIPRTRIILEHGEAKVFEPFDRFAQFEDSKGKSLGELLDEFADLRAENLEALERMALTAQDMERTGQHPEFGKVTLGQLLATWTVHDFSHIAQISRVMSKQYKDEVGPWSAYLRVVKE
jgi:hypothetical protein